MAMIFRFAEAKDAEKFAKWAAENPQIDPKDKLAATKEQNPTTTFLVIEEDGEPIMFMPVYMVMRIGYLGFNPENAAEKNKEALEVMLNALKHFAMAYHIGSVDTLTKSGIPVAEWAKQRGFVPDSRELFSLPITRKDEGMVH